MLFAFLFSLFDYFWSCLLQRYAVDPATALYIDDSARNVAAAEALGMQGWWFHDPAGLREHLIERGLLARGTRAISHG